MSVDAGPQREVVEVGAASPRRRAPRSCAGGTPLTAPSVPTGMKAGVRDVAVRRGEHAGARGAVGWR